MFGLSLDFRFGLVFFGFWVIIKFFRVLVVFFGKWEL